MYWWVRLKDLALCRSCSQRVAVGTGVPARTPAAGPVLTPHQLSFAVLDPPPADWKMPLPLVATLPTNRLKLTLSVPLSWAMAPPAPVGVRKVSAARLFTKWVRRIVTVPPLALACSPPPAAAAARASAVARDRRVGDGELFGALCEKVDAATLAAASRTGRVVGDGAVRNDEIAARTRCNATARAGAVGVAIYRHAVQRQRANAIRVAVDDTAAAKGAVAVAARDPKIGDAG